MTREEEIIETAKFIYSPSSGIPQSLSMRVGFIEGAKWADKTMIERALTFIYENFYDHPHVSGHICTDSFESLEQMEEELIKAMEDENSKRTI